jgi:hypothetical protein
MRTLGINPCVARARLKFTIEKNNNCNKYNHIYS